MRLASLTVPLAALIVLGIAGRKREPSDAPRYEPPKVVHSVQANYPVNSVAAGGAVVLEAELDETGALREMRVLRDVPSLTQPAKAALRQWKFEPARLDGKPVASRLPVVFSFNIPYWCGPGPRRNR
jgi:protein TonB